MSNFKTASTRITTQEKRSFAIELRKQGHTLQEIADNLQCSKTYAYKLLVEAIRELTLLTVEETAAYRELESMRLDALWQAAYPMALLGDIPAINACIRISERRSKLYGFDGAQRIEHSGGVNIVLKVVDCSTRDVAESRINNELPTAAFE